MTPFYDLNDGITFKELEAMKDVEESSEEDDESTNKSLESVDFGKNNITKNLSVLIVTIGAFAAGTFISWTSSALPRLRLEYPGLTSTQETWISCVLNLGAFFGAIPTGLIAERFGRKRTLLCLAIPMIMSWLLIAFKTSIVCIYVGRFVGGVAVGALSVAIPPYVAEMAQPGTRYYLSQCVQIQLTAGILAGYITGLFTVTTMSLILLVFPVIYFIGFLFMPESPVYLLSQGKVEEAKNSLLYLRGVDCDLDQEVNRMRKYINESISADGNFKDLFATPSNVKSLIVAFILMILQQMTGITTIIFHLGRILERSDVDSSMTIVIGVTQLVSTCFSAMYFMKVGRRPMMIVSNGIMGMSALILGIFFHLHFMCLTRNQSAIPVIFLSIFVSFYSIGVGPIPWLMLRELFPANIKRRATAISAGVNWFMAFLMTAVFNTMLASVEIGWVMCFYAFVCVMSSVFVYYFVPETRARTIGDIQTDFNKNGPRRHKHIIVIESECKM